MVEAILKDKKMVLPCSAYLEGEYGLKDIFFGVPVTLGRGGVEKVWEITLTLQERTMLNKSAELIRSTMAALKL